MRIGIDVGGTNTDAVLMNGKEVISWTKTPTTANVSDGISTALATIINTSKIDTSTITGVMIGTTHFTNAVVERKHLTPTTCIRLGLPATTSLPPMIDWADDLREVIGGHYHFAHGGYEFDGRELSPFDPDVIQGITEQVKAQGIKAIAISSVFSPVNPAYERQTADIIQATIPDATITLSSEIGRIGLLERENAAIMNACLRELADRTVNAFQQALADMQITAPFYGLKK